MLFVGTSIIHPSTEGVFLLCNILDLLIYRLKNILYGQSKNAGVVTIKKICDGLDVTIQEFFADPIFADLEPEL